MGCNFHWRLSPQDLNPMEDVVGGVHKSPWMQRAMIAVKKRMPVSFISDARIVVWKLQDRLAGTVTYHFVKGSGYKLG